MPTDELRLKPAGAKLKGLCLVACWLVLTSCAASAGLPTADRATVARATVWPSPSPTLEVASTPGPTATVTRSILPDSGWQVLRVGLERRVINLLNDEGRLLESFYILRLEPDSFRFDVGYAPGQPRGLLEWQQRTDALLVVNGGFFTEAYEATGLIISAGQASGTSFRGFGGMLAINERGPTLRWLADRPHDPSEALTGGLQSFPMLIRPGGRLGADLADNGDKARRTVIGQDREGRFLFIIAMQGNLSLTELGALLAQSDLALDSALNLDGGASTGLLLAEPEEGVVAFSLLPAVILVYAR